MSEAWVHIAVEGPQDVDIVRHRLNVDGLFFVLAGDTIGSLSDFYREIEGVMPLVVGFGRNQNALIDLLRTLGSGDYAGKRHCLLWRRPERFLNASPDEFWSVADTLLGVAKELLVGDELDPTFERTDSHDWVSSRLDLVFLVEFAPDGDRLEAQLSRLSDSWGDEFRSLEVPLNRELLERG